jgi:hypothetical protein
LPDWDRVKTLQRPGYLEGAAGSVVVSFLGFLLFLVFFFVVVSLDGVFCANTTVPDNRDKPNAAVMIILIFGDSPWINY